MATKLDGHASSGQLTFNSYDASLSSDISPTKTRQRQSQSQHQHASPPKPCSIKNDDGRRKSSGTCKRMSSCKTTATASSTTFSNSMSELSLEAIALTATPLHHKADTAPAPGICKSAHHATQRRASKISTVAPTELATCMGGNNSNRRLASVPYQVEKPVSLISAKQRTMPQLSSLFPTRPVTSGAGVAAAKASTSPTAGSSSPIRRSRAADVKSSNKTHSLFTSIHTSPPPGATSVNHMLQTAKY